MSESIEQEPQTIQELAEEVRQAKSEAKDARRMAQQAQQTLLEVREREMEKDQRIADLKQEVESLEDELATLRDRTGLLETVKSASSMQIDKRAAVLIQTLYNKAWKRKESSANVESKAMMDYNAAEGALGGTVDRSKIYRTFQKAEELVDNKDVVEYVEEDRGSKKNTRLRLSLDGGSVPATIAGQQITKPEVART